MVHGSKSKEHTTALRRPESDSPWELRDLGPDYEAHPAVRDAERVPDGVFRAKCTTTS